MAPLRGSGGTISCQFPLALARTVPDEDAIAARWAAARQTVERTASAPNRPAAMAAFDVLLSSPGRFEQLAADPRPVVGSFCNFVPEELVLAAGAIPLRVDLGDGAAAALGGQAGSPDLCPEVRAILGAHLGRLPPLELCDLLVIPTACDGKKKLAQTLGEQRECWLLELPQGRDWQHQRRRWHEEITALGRRLEQLTGRRIKRRALRQAVEQINRRSQLVRRLNELRWHQPGLLGGRDAFLVLQASFIADVSWWCERTEALVQELAGSAKERGRDPGSAPPVRLLISGSPVIFPSHEILQLIEEAGGLIVADEMCSGTARLYHPTVLDEGTLGGMLRAAAERTLLPCTCPCFASADLRIERILELVEQSGAQGVVHHTLRLCQLYDLELPRLAAALRTRGVPLLALQAELGAEASGRLKTRVEAFLEMIQSQG